MNICLYTVPFTNTIFVVRPYFFFPKVEGDKIFYLYVYPQVVCYMPPLIWRKSKVKTNPKIAFASIKLFFSSSFLCDVTMKSVDGKEFPCHKCVLCARLGRCTFCWLQIYLFWYCCLFLIEFFFSFRIFS